MPVPSWVAVVTFLLCWGFGGFILFGAAQRGSASTPLLAVGVLLMLFPLLSFQGLVPVILSVISRWLGNGGR